MESCVSSFPFTSDPFTLGVASGDPLPDGVVLWTRLAPGPLAGVDLPQRALAVEWEVATDEGMRQIARRGSASALPDLAHSVHVEVSGLDPDRWYWYRFRSGGAESQIARTRTAPAAGATPERLRFAFASCQNYAQGYYTAYQHMAREDVDLVLFLGDYIYEGTARGGVREYRSRTWSFSLRDYRDRYAQYKSDADLRAAHALFPWILTWDDHEVENNYAGGVDAQDQRNKAFLAERAAAYQAYYEHQPLRAASLPKGPELRLFRAPPFGDLATFHVLDTRQYRSAPAVRACAQNERAPDGHCATALDPGRTMLGAEQRAWLTGGLGRSRARWDVLAQSVRFAQHDFASEPDRHDFGDGDDWDGYVADRRALLAAFARGPRNPVVVSGDSHRNYVYDLKADFGDPRSPTVATEFLGTSISSDGDPASPVTQHDPSPKNPHWRFYDDHRGYVLCALDRRQWRTDFRIVSTVRAPSATVSTVASFGIEDRRPGAARG